MSKGTCPNEERLLAALSLEEEPDEIPSFCQSLMAKICADYDKKYGDTIDEEVLLFSSIGDMTMYKAFGYSSHWSGSPSTHLVVDDAWRDEVDQVNEEFSKGDHPEYALGYNGSVRGSGMVNGFPMGWFVKPYITTPDKVRFFLDQASIEPPKSQDIENYRKGRLECFEKNFVPLASSNMVMEPGLQTIGLALMSRLIRKNPDLLKEYFQFLTDQSYASMKAAIEAGYKVFIIADDCAYKQGPMMNPKHYQEFVVPCFKQVTDLVHEHGGKIILHTDGWIHPILDCIVDMGMDGINPLEVQSGMKIADVKKTHGDKLCCVGNVDTAEVLPFGTPDRVRAAVRQCFREGGKRGYIFSACGSLHHEVQLENALAMMDEWKKINAGEVSL